MGVSQRPRHHQGLTRGCRPGSTPRRAPWARSSSCALRLSPPVVAPPLVTPVPAAPSRMGGPRVDAAPQRGRSPWGPPSSREAPVAPMSLLRVDENTKRLIQGRLRLRKPGLRFSLGSLSRSPTGNLVSGPAHRGPGSDRLPLPPTSQACVGEAGTRRAIPETRLPEPWARRCRVTLLGGGRANPWMHTTGKGEKATTMDVPCARICVFCPDHSTRAQKRRGRGGVGVGSQAASSPPTHGAGAREFVRPAGHCQTSHTRDVLKLRGLRYREGVSLETVSA